MSLGKRLKAERKKRGWSQIYVAERIGITNAVLSNYERDYRDPDTDTLIKLADLFDADVDYLLGRSNDRPNLDEKSSSRAYYGGGDDWTEEEKEMADAFIRTIRDRQKAEKLKKQKD